MPRARAILAGHALAPSFLALLILLHTPVMALAHAHYDHSTPTIGQVLSAPPGRVDIFTDSEMRKTAGANAIMVISQDGSRVDDGNTIVDDSNRQHFSVGLQPNLPNGGAEATRRIAQRRAISFGYTSAKQRIVGEAPCAGFSRVRWLRSRANRRRLAFSPTANLAKRAWGKAGPGAKSVPTAVREC